ncbi:MAG: TonB family protein [Pseudomonadota bacterium]
MNYASQSGRPSPAALLGALSVPMIAGAALVAGLAVSVVITKPDPNPTGVLIDPQPIPLPPPPPEPAKQEAPSNQPPIAQAPQPIPRPDAPLEFDLSPAPPLNPFGDTGPGLLPPLGPISPGPISPGPITPPIDAAPLADPINAIPRGNPGNWVRDSDYRPRWMREGMSGVARFSVEIDARGRVTECRITGSTGHSALDQATCRLVTRRARFNPALDSAGKAVPSSYSNAVRWQIPD